MKNLNAEMTATYNRIMQIARGPLTDSKVALYAFCDPRFSNRLPLLPRGERLELLGQIKPRSLANPSASDRDLCKLVVQTWASDAARRAMPQIKTDVQNEYWNGDPEGATPSVFRRVADFLRGR